MKFGEISPSGLGGKDFLQFCEGALGLFRLGKLAQ